MARRIFPEGTEWTVLAVPAEMDFPDEYTWVTRHVEARDPFDAVSRAVMVSGAAVRSLITDLGLDMDDYDRVRTALDRALKADEFGH